MGDDGDRRVLGTEDRWVSSTKPALGATDTQGASTSAAGLGCTSQEPPKGPHTPVCRGEGNRNGRGRRERWVAAGQAQGPPLSLEQFCDTQKALGPWEFYRTCASFILL